MEKPWAGRWLTSARRTLPQAVAVLVALEIVSIVLVGNHIQTGFIALRARLWNRSARSPHLEYSPTDTLVRIWERDPAASSYLEWASRGGLQQQQPKVLVLTPMKDSEKDLLRYFALLDRLTYPKHLMSLGILEGDSTDATFAKLMDILAKLHADRAYRRVTLIKKNMQNGNRALNGHERHSYDRQGQRRSTQAKCRNHLQRTALRDEDVILWLDSDLKQYPADLIETMLATGARIAAANCIQPSGKCYDRNNWRETASSLVVKSQLSADALLFEGYNSKMRTYRESLCDIDDADVGDLVALDGVGGTALMVEADLVREGLFFPTFPYKHAIETEGIAQVAKSMGVEVVGLRTLKVFHEAD
ncbi:Glycosyltransferase 2-like domain-containing protein [Plasmodiophora brassicae]